MIQPVALAKDFPECPFQKKFPSALNKNADYFMALAYNQAIDAWREGEIPVGAVIEYEGEIIAQAHNQVEQLHDPTAHAEMLAITQAGVALADWRLNGATLYVTKEPCPMCSGAAVMSRLFSVVYAVGDKKMGCLGGAASLHEIDTLNHRLSVFSGVLQQDCLTLTQTFFKLKRENVIPT